MATQESRRAALLTLLEESEERVQRIATITGQAATGVTTNNLQGLLDNFRRMRSNIASIDLDRVKYLRGNGSDTDDEFESKISDSREALTTTYIGVKARIDSLFTDKVVPTAGLKILGELNELRQRLQQSLAIFRSRYLQVLTSWWLWGGILVAGLVSIPLYYIYFVHAGSPDQDVARLVHEDVLRKAVALHTIVNKPDQSFLEKSTEVMKQLSEFIHTIPKVLTGIGLAIAAAQKLLVSARRKSL